MTLDNGDAHPYDEKQRPGIGGEGNPIEPFGLFPEEISLVERV